jgi:hypothetical protein
MSRQKNACLESKQKGEDLQNKPRQARWAVQGPPFHLNSLSIVTDTAPGSSFMSWLSMRKLKTNLPLYLRE